MNKTSLVLVFLIGFVFWGGWALWAHASNIRDPIVRGFVVNFITAVGFLPFVWNKLSLSDLKSKSGLFLLIAGISNFIGHILFPKLQVTAGSQASIYLSIIPALAGLAGAIGGVVFFKEHFSLSKAFFITMIMAGIIGLALVSTENNAS